MAVALSDLVKDLSREDILEDLLTIARALGLSTSAWQPGEPIRGLLVILAEQLSRFWNRYVVKAIRAGFLDYAEGAWLTLVALAFYGVSRREATFATGSVTIENRGGGFWNFVPGDLRIKNSASGKTYLSQSGGVLPPWSGAGPYPTLTLTFQADEVGSESSAAIGEIADYPTPLVTGPAGVYAQTNTAELLGEDEEDDDDLKHRCRISTGPLTDAGPRSAYESIALAVRKDSAGNLYMPGAPDYDRAVATSVSRVRVVDVGGGVLRVWLASPTGPAAGDTKTAGSDVFLVNVAIQMHVVPDGLTAIVAPAVAHPVAVDVTVYVDRASNVTAAEAQKAAEDAITRYFTKLAIGGARTSPGGQGYVFASEVAAKAANIAGAVKATMAGGDVALGEGEVAVPSITVTAIVVTQ